ncbi:DUF421 domain-containing protein [Yoonia litorea]|uniref:YetF C-terminal domain-containing protein n=1 Tax=Yoonia litorea TaxID=1123755 RepID=A0A1I6LV47_9RHOB|nr:YetF domain-containing protein [Yoonia litorea]SFS07276.1 Protein of unknown function [Yoonia litorea]
MQFFPDDLTELWQAAFGGILAYVAIIFAVRLMGLRSFAKMAPHDFAVTVAIGSVLAGAAMANSTPLSVPLMAIAVLFTLQWIATRLAARHDSVQSTISNTPLLLMDGPQILHDNLSAAHVSEADLIAKLREANVLHYDQVVAVVMEATGDISVLHRASDTDFDDRMLSHVSRHS